MSIIQTLLTIIGVLFGMFVFERSKRQSAETLNQNSTTKKEENTVDEKITEDNGLIQTEEEKEKEIKKQIDEDKAENSTNLDGLVDFFKRH